MTGSSTPHSSSGQVVTCDLVAYAWLRASADLVAEWRRNPGPGPGQRLGPSFLKNADEQTVVGLAAVCHALDGHGLGSAPLTDWGVVAAPCLIGRPMMVAAVQRYLAEGAWGISPNLIPHRSLHSLSGTISQALKAHGPNFGAGSAREALYCAAGLLASQSAPGVLIVLTAWVPEPFIQRTGSVPAGTDCAALALAVAPPHADGRCTRLMIAAGRTGHATPLASPAAPLDLLRLHQLLELTLGGTAPTHVVQPLDDGGCLELVCAFPARTPPLVRVPAVHIRAGAALTVTEAAT